MAFSIRSLQNQIELRNARKSIQLRHKLLGVRMDRILHWMNAIHFTAHFHSEWIQFINRTFFFKWNHHFVFRAKNKTMRRRRRHTTYSRVYF